MDSFIHSVHLCRRDANFFSSWSYFICSLVEYMPVPATYFARSFATCRGFPLCHSQALILSVRLCNSPPWAPLFTYPTRSGWLPLTVRVFQSILITYLSTLGINASDYSGLRFRRGGATFALECGIPTEVIKAQGVWVSSAYDNYIHPSWEMRKKLAATMGSRV